MSDRRPEVRAALDTIPAYVPGKPPAPMPGRPTYKLSSNENPHPPLPGVLDAVTGAAAQMNRYPDMSASRLYERLGGRLAVPVGDLALATGSVAVLYHLLQALCQEGDEVVIAWRSFEAYPIAIGLTGARTVAVPLSVDARHDLAAMAAAVTERTKAVLVCTPNNPTGPAVHRDELEQLLAVLPSRVVVVVDEAYVEFVADPGVASGLDLYRERDNVVVLRTFSKAYGLAGLRVGYAIAPEPLAAAIRKAALPFGVSQVAQDAAVASLERESELLERVAAVVAERGRMVAALSGQGWDVPDAQGNFVWLALGADSVDFATAAAAAGVMVRPFAGDGVRVSIGEPDGNDVLLETAGQFRKSGRG
ncbi:MAG: histidinol-phosphate transaminase [Actinomycetota bacterium]|nr:histidinol-phosphate transaminase [Actinomycetota bacterium]